MSDSEWDRSAIASASVASLVALRTVPCALVPLERLLPPELTRNHDGGFVQGTSTAKPYARTMSLEVGGVAQPRSSRDPYQLIIFGCAAVASLVVHFLGPSFKINVDDLLQVLDPTLLTHHLLGSLWNLHEQPPLFNLGIGILLRLPSGLQAPIAEFVYFLLYAMICMATYASMTLLSIPRKLALGVVLAFVVLDPAATALLEDDSLRDTYRCAGDGARIPGDQTRAQPDDEEWSAVRHRWNGTFALQHVPAALGLHRSGRRGGTVVARGATIHRQGCQHSVRRLDPVGPTHDHQFRHARDVDVDGDEPCEDHDGRRSPGLVESAHRAQRTAVRSPPSNRSRHWRSTESNQIEKATEL